MYFDSIKILKFKVTTYINVMWCFNTLRWRAWWQNLWAFNFFNSNQIRLLRDCKFEILVPVIIDVLFYFRSCFDYKPEIISLRIWDLEFSNLNPQCSFISSMLQESTLCVVSEFNCRGLFIHISHAIIGQLTSVFYLECQWLMNQQICRSNWLSVRCLHWLPRIFLLFFYW